MFYYLSLLLITMLITNDDLYKKQYSINELEENINQLYGKTILCTQIINAEFCAKYILNENYSDGVEEDYLYSVDYIMRKQPHITEKELVYWIEKIPNAYYM